MSVVPLLTGFFLTILYGVLAAPVFNLAKFGQSIRTEGPSAHQLKQGTLTMGGLIILASLLTGFFWYPIENPLLRNWIGLVSGFGLIGGIDDSLKIFRGRNEGLTIRQKFSAQVVLALIFVVSLQIHPLHSAIGLGHPLLYAIFGTLVIVGTANAVNLTDGLDGLAPGLLGMSFMGIALLTPHASLMLFVAGAIFGFLWFNKYPAQWFMGDLGSLSLGAGLGGMAIIFHMELVLLVLGGVFVIETLSVILQVTAFKRIGKRILRMSPLHHHFELGGLSEAQVVRRFWLAGFLCTLAAIAFRSIGIL